jgi:TPR repeat protein
MEGKSEESDRKIVISSSKDISVRRDIQSPVIDEIISKALVDKDSSLENLSADDLVRMGKSLLRSKGRGDTRENKKAYDCFQKASLKGHPEGTWMLYNCIIYADGTTYDQTDAYWTLIKAADLGCPSAEYRYAVSLISGEDHEINIEKGLRSARSAMDHGETKGDEFIASYLFNSLSYGGTTGILRNLDYSISKQQFNFLLERCEYNNIFEMYQVFSILSSGKYKEKTDYDIAYKWLFESIDYSFIDSLLAYSNAEKIVDYPLPAEIEDSYKYFLESASDEGDAQAKLHMGLNYIYHRNGFTNNNGKGIELLIKSFREGNKDAGWHLWRIYEEGKILEKDMKKAEYYLLEAATRGSRSAHMELFGKSNKNYTCRIEESFNILLNAINNGGKKAHFQLAYNYINRLMYFKNPNFIGFEKAMEHFQIASDMGYAQSSYELAMLYHKGFSFTPIKEDKKKAGYYFYKGSLQGCTNCMTWHVSYLQDDKRYCEAIKWSIIGSLQSEPDSKNKIYFDKAIDRIKTTNSITDSDIFEIFNDSNDYVNDFNNKNS